ncbi:Pre-mRNA-splicing factor Cwf15/Cwc15 [Globomyces pollinis-pini]|nr:Pre-mRNA-splicing factor Cwf15/Cwc15 [Globomyces pollinis-pini]
MTSAARPTFLPAIGGHSLRDTGAGPSTLKSAKDLASHTKLKFRTNLNQDTSDLKAKLIQKENEYKLKLKTNIDSSSKDIENNKFIQLQNLDADDTDDDDGDLEDSDSDSDDEDDTAELLRELEKIKHERLLEQQRLEREEKEAEEREKEEKAMTGNPLLNADAMEDGTNFTVKRRWDEDVIFKNQSRGVPEVPKKRFINDMLRSDFHRKFMDKYVK